MRSIDLVATVRSAGPYHPNWGLGRDHRPDLHTRGVRPEQSSIEKIKSIRIVAGGMIRGRIQRVKTVPFRLYIRPIRKSETEPAKDAHGTVLQKRQRMHASDPKRRSRQGFVDANQSLCFAGSLQRLQAFLQGARDRVPKLVQ